MKLNFWSQFQVNLADMNSVALIQGASGGLGKAFVQRLLSTTRLNVVATSRDPTSLLSSLRSTYGDDLDFDRLKVLAMDVREESTIERAAKEVANEHGKGCLKLLINVSGVVSLFCTIYNVTRAEYVDRSYIPIDRLLKSKWMNSFINTKSDFLPNLNEIYD